MKLLMEYYDLNDYIKKFNLSDKIYPSDIECYINLPEFNFVYNKLWLSRSMGMLCGPMGVYPVEYPIIFKPIVNLYGFSRGFKKILNEKEYELEKKDGFFWQPFFGGKHIVCDLVLDNTHIVFCSFLRSYPGREGSFKLHHTTEYILPEKIKKWISKYLINYSGCLNLEIIDGNIIECHLRLNGDFNLYSKEFCLQLHRFMEKKTNIIEYSIPNIYIFPIFIERRNIYQFSKKKKKLVRLLKRSKYTKTVLFDNINSESQTHLVRVIMFDTYHFMEGLKLQKCIEYSI